MEKEISTEIEINAPPSRVWWVLTDFEKYPTWNPFIKKISGILARNEKLEVHMPDPRGGMMVFTPDVLVAERERELRWLGRSEGNAFNGEHCFLIEPQLKTITIIIKCTLLKVKNSQVQLLRHLKDG
jgi:hypothetical protein